MVLTLLELSQVVLRKVHVHVIVVPWLLKCVGFVPPKGNHALLRAKPEEVYDKPQDGAIPRFKSHGTIDLYHNSLYRLALMSLSTCSICKRLHSASAIRGICTYPAVL